MNIMQICSGGGLNGAAYSTLLLTRELARRGHRLFMVCPRGAWIGEQLAADPIEVIWSDLHRWPPDELRRIAKMVHKRRVDILHTHSSRAHFFGVLLRWFSGVPCVATAHCCHFQLHWMFNDYVIAVSEATRRYHVAYNLVRRARSETIYNFIDYRRMSEIPNDARRRTRSWFGVDDTTHLIGTVGSVIPRKGLIYLVRALPKILKHGRNVRLVVVGSRAHAKYVRQVKSTAAQLGVASHILWTGESENVLEILAGLDVYVHPALDEPLGRAVLEAMAVGLPVVGTAVGGIPECTIDESTGTLVPPADSDALADAVTALLRDASKRAEFGANGQRRVQEEFSPEVQTSRTEAIFQRVVVGRKMAA